MEKPNGLVYFQNTDHVIDVWTMQLSSHLSRPQLLPCLHGLIHGRELSSTGSLVKPKDTQQSSYPHTILTYKLYKCIIEFGNLLLISFIYLVNDEIRVLNLSIT